MYSTACAATIGWQDRGEATLTRPAPARIAPWPHSTAAPLFPIDPATTSTRPKSPLCASAARGWINARMRSKCRHE